MRQVKVKKGELLEKVYANRERHAAIHEDATRGWRVQVGQLAADLGRCVDDRGRLVRVELLPGPDEIDEWRRAIVRLAQPEQHLAEYDQVITMLEMSIDDEIELSWQEFQQYVMDEWSWKETWKMSNSRYTTVERA